jgi:hypothetical protein
LIDTPIPAHYHPPSLVAASDEKNNPEGRMAAKKKTAKKSAAKKTATKKKSTGRGKKK